MSGGNSAVKENDMTTAFRATLLDPSRPMHRKFFNRTHIAPRGNAARVAAVAEIKARYPMPTDPWGENREAWFAIDEISQPLIDAVRHEGHRAWVNAVSIRGARQKLVG